MSQVSQGSAAGTHLKSGADAGKPVFEPVSEARSRRREWKTRAWVFGIPLICVAYGTDAQGRPIVAKGLIAVGQFAVGLVAIGQIGIGLIGVGQLAIGVIAFGQVAFGLLAGFGQLAVGMFAGGQLVIGKYARGQFGWAEYLWSPHRTDMEAVAMFESIEWLVRQDWSTIWDTLKDAVALGI
jgi:hypothetical protein